MKELPAYSHLDFCLPIVGLAVLGVAFTTTSQHVYINLLNDVISRFFE